MNVTRNIQSRHPETVEHKANRFIKQTRNTQIQKIVIAGWIHCPCRLPQVVCRGRSVSSSSEQSAESIVATQRQRALNFKNGS